MLHCLQLPVIQYIKMLPPCRFPGTKAAYEAVVDVADNEVIADAQVSSINCRQLCTQFELNLGPNLAIQSHDLPASQRS